MAISAASTLASRIATALPAQCPPLTLHQLSAQPAPSTELFSAPPGEAPDSTTCESHFLSASIRHNGQLIQVFAIEILVYVTESLITLFISKADSTGYLGLGLPTKPPSPTKAVVASFLEYLIEQKKRADTRLVVSLFARAQNQYLFPGSIDNLSKHVLDDRALIKWWCRILDSIIQKYPSDDSDAPLSARGNIVVPGCDAYETRAFIPRSISGKSPRWSPTDPLRTIGKPPGVPERCLIPRFPDDPKARFVKDLDDELPDEDAAPTQASPSKTVQPGKWRSVRSLAQFWELMAFRQECAAGRLVGFLWGIWEPAGLRDRPFEARLFKAEEKPEGAPKDLSQEPQLPTPQASQVRQDPQDPLPLLSSQPLPSEPLLDTTLSPPASSQVQAPPVLEVSSAVEPLSTQDALTSSGASTAPEALITATISCAVPLILSASAYSSAMTLLDTLDYADVTLATNSTRTFLATAAKEANLAGPWTGVEIEAAQSSETQLREVDGAKSVSERGSEGGAAVAVLGAGLVRKKRRAMSGAAELDGIAGDREKVPAAGEQGPKVLAAGLVRKKPKV